MLPFQYSESRFFRIRKQALPADKCCTANMICKAWHVCGLILKFY